MKIVLWNIKHGGEGACSLVIWNKKNLYYNFNNQYNNKTSYNLEAFNELISGGLGDTIRKVRI